MGMKIQIYQLLIDSFIWEKGPRLRMYLKFYPDGNFTFNSSEILRIRNMFSGWEIPDDDTFGPYEFLNFTLLKPYIDGIYDHRPYLLTMGNFNKRNF